MAKRNFWFFLSGLTFILFFQSQYAKAQYELLKVGESLEKSEGKVTAYYPKYIETYAKRTQDLLSKAVDYYNRQLGISFPLSVVLLGPEEYARYTKETVPYKNFLPFVTSGPPNVMGLPAISGSALDSLTQLALKEKAVLKDVKLSIPEISQRFTALVGLHELGHMYIRELEICQEVGWFQEMMANFIADAFLTDVSPSDALIWRIVNEAYDRNLKPINRRFGGMGGNQESYVWWQGHITLRAHEVYQKNGFEFIHNLRKLSNVKIYHDTDLSFIVALDKIAPGFEEWAQYHGHITNEDKIYIDSVRAEVQRETSDAIASNMPNLYTATYANEWEKGNTSYKKIAMTFLKDFENNNIKKEDLFSEEVELQFRGVHENLEKAKAIARFGEMRSGLKNLKLRLNSIIPLFSADRDEDWVFVDGSMIITKADATLEKIEFIQQFRIDKERKISSIKHYEFKSK